MDKEIADLIEYGLRGNVIDNLLEGWIFRIEEVSSNVFRINGIDKQGKVVSAYGVNPEEVLSACLQRARRVDSIKHFFQKLLAPFKMK